MHARVTDFFIYRWRYPLGYLSITALLLVVVGIAVFSTPGALRAGEMSATVQSAALSVESLDTSMVINLPYHILQRGVFMLFGVSTFTIKLPSIILGTLTIIGIFFLARIWFRRNVAILTTILAATSTQFLFLVQDGTPAIVYSFVVIWLLLSGTLVTRRYMFNTFWKVVAGVLLASALYMPLGIHLVLAVAITASLHPHIRYIIKHVPRLRLILALSLALGAVTPLVYACIVDPTTLRTLLGINVSGFSWHDNIAGMWHAFAGFLTPASSYIILPLYSLGIVVLMTIGLYRLWRQRHTARGYLVFILGGLLLPFIFLDLSQVTSVFALGAILMAYGISHLISTWYRLFPKNPYARAAGLIPLSILVLGMVYSGVVRYTNNYTSSPQVLSFYTTDLRLLDGTLKKMGDTPITVVATGEEFAFYNVVAHYDTRFTASETLRPSSTHIVTRTSHQTIQPQTEIDTIVASPRAQEADRFYIYKTSSK
jgi:hypothetical protein